MSAWRFAEVLVLASLVAACNHAASDAPAPAARPDAAATAQDAATPVKTVHPEYQTRATVLETTGKVVFNEDGLTRVQAPVTGRVTEVLAKPGDVVEPGARLLVLDSPDLGAAKSDYAKAVSDSERAEKALRLARELFEVKAIAEKEVREADNDHRKAAAERERAAARLRTLGVPDSQLADIAARTDASTTLVVHAPRSGVIVERNVSAGQVVAYGQSDTPVNLFVIADLSTMWVMADVYEPDIPRVRVGQTATIRLPCCPDERHEGRVVYISDSVDKDTRTVKVRIVVPNRSRQLKNEMFVRTQIATGATNLLVIPQSAVHRAEGDTFVLVEKAKDEYERRPVKLGADLDGVVEVREGVTPRDRVVSEGSILLKRTLK